MQVRPRIKLISPRMSLRPMDSRIKTQMAPPLSLLVLGALTPPEYDVEIADENVERVRHDDSPDLVGITVKADTVARACQIAGEYRSRGVAVVMGGIFPTSCPEMVAPHADAVAVGEGENIWPRVLRDLTAGRLGKLYRSEEQADLAESPVPRWELIAGKDYLYANTLCISRGCPWRCDFCYKSAPNFPGGYRAKPVANVLAEIESLGTSHVMFVDDNLLGNPGYTRRLLAAMRPLGLTWHAAVSADVGRHPDILDMMAESGCRSLFIGFETVNPENLASCRKHQNRAELYAGTISEIHRRGIMVNASIVFGFDGDTPAVFDNTVEWLAERKIETMTAHILTPYPGTPLYARLHAAGRIIDHDLRHYNTSRAVFLPKHMSPEELERGYLGAYREFYSWRRILQRVPAAPRQRTAFMLFNVFYRKFGRTTALFGRMGLMGALGRAGKTLAYPRSRRFEAWLRTLKAVRESLGESPDSLLKGGNSHA
jgi:radical SAM superfamily enzyme YgiQ (UPF0313 family)